MMIQIRVWWVRHAIFIIWLNSHLSLLQCIKMRNRINKQEVEHTIMTNWLKQNLPHVGNYCETFWSQETEKSKPNQGIGEKKKETVLQVDCGGRPCLVSKTLLIPLSSTTINTKWVSFTNLRKWWTNHGRSSPGLC